MGNSKEQVAWFLPLQEKTAKNQLQEKNKKITGRGTYGLRVGRDTSTKCDRRRLIAKATGSSNYLSDTIASQTG